MKEILITSSVLIVVLLLLRLIFAKKVRRTLIYAAWALVALRLLIPIQIGQLSFSVLTAAKPLTETVTGIEELRVIGQNEREAEIQVTKDYIQQDVTVFTPEVQEYIRQEQAENTPAEEIATALVKTQGSEVYVPEVRQQVQQQVAEQTNFVSIGQVATVIWLVGVAGMAVWFLVVNLRHGRKLRKHREKLECESPIPVFVSDQVGSPCLVGLFRPVIYLTPESAADAEIRRHVLTHELTHYAHKDHVWSVVRCICLCAYWFDPLVWAAAWCSRRDCELACDEGALRRLGEGQRIAYGRSLLEVVSHASAPAHLMQTATSMNETKEQLKQRVNFIVKKPKWSIIAAVCMVLLCAIVAGCAAAGPTTEAPGLENTDPTTGSTAATEPTSSEPVLVPPNTWPAPQDPEELLAMIPVETQNQIKNDYVEQFFPEYAGMPEIIEGVSLRVFGVFGDSYVLFVDGLCMYFQALMRGSFGLLYSDSQQMYLYRDGYFYSSGITPEEQSQVASNYYNAYPYLKEILDNYQNHFGQWIPAIDSTLTEEIKILLRDALYVQQGRRLYWESGARYYGDFGDFYVFFTPDSSGGGKYVSRIEDLEFVFETGGTLWVYKDGVVKPLQYAYQQQMITYTQLHMIYIAHGNQQTPVLNTQTVSEETLQPYIAVPTEETIARVSNIWFVKENHRWDWDGKTGYYGTYGEYVVVFVMGPLPEESSIQVADYRLRCMSSFAVYVFTENDRYDLQQAYEDGLLTYEEIGLIYTCHMLNMSKIYG